MGASSVQALTPQGAVTITSTAAGVYGNAYTATATGGNGTGAIVWGLGSGSTASGAAINASSGAVTATSIGTVKIKAYRAGDSTYAQAATTADFTITLSPRPITVTLAGAKNYDGTTTPSGASASITSGSLAVADTISYTFNNTPSASVGSYSAQAGGGIAFRSSSSGGDYSGTVALAKPSGTAASDVLLACISSDGNSATTTPPTGWTSLGAAYNYYDGQTSEVFLRVVDGTEGAAFNFGNSASTAAGLILCYSGVNPGAPLNVAAAHGTNDSAISSGGAVTAPSITTTTNGTMLVWLAGLDGDGNSGAATFTAPSGYTLRQTSNYSWNYESAADRIQATAGATGTVAGSAAFPGGAGTFGFTVALAPAGGTSLVTATLSNPASYTVTYAGAYTITNVTAPAISSATTASGQVGAAFSYQITASNTPTSFSATGLPAGLSVNTSTGLISGTPTAAGTNSVTVRATNAGGTGSATLNLPIANSSSAVVAINAGGSAVGSFAADNYFNAGTVVVYPGTAVIDTSGVSNPPPSAVYQSVRWGDLTYTLPGLTPGASYKVRLHFAELYFTAANQRQFNVAINGSTVLTNFDIVAAAGGMNRAVVREFNNTANASGQILVQFSTGAYNYADISAIEVVALGGTAPVLTGPTTASGQTGAAFSYQIIASGNPTSYSATGLPPGLSINTSTGLISGTPTTLGSTSVTISATNSGGTVSSTITLTILATLPYTTDFESGQGYMLASLQGQQGWTVSSGAASVTNSDHSNGTQSVVLTASNPSTSISESFGSSPTNSIEYFDFFAKPAAQAGLGSSATFTVEGAKFALQVSGSQGLLRVYSGNGSGGGTWTSTAFSTALTTGNVTAAWVRFTARLDFTHQTWDLYANGAMVAADIPFTTTGSTYLSVFQMLGDVTTASRLDYIYAGPTNPVFADTNNNGIDDNWETAHGFSLGANNRNTSPTGNGVTVIQAYVNGTDPNDYYNGSAPTLSVISGNNQSAFAGQFNTQPFDIMVWNAAGTAPLVNAPVTFKVVGTGALLAATNASNAQLYNALAVYSDANGTVQAYFKQPASGGIATQINVTAGSAQVSLLTQSIAITSADTDNDGLRDDWELQYFGHGGVDKNADPDGDGLNNLIESQLGTNPLGSTTNASNPAATLLKIHRPN